MAFLRGCAVTDFESVKSLADETLRLIKRDYDTSLGRVDAYLRGEHDDPYDPRDMRAEYKDLIPRSKQNWVKIPVNASTQALAVDGVRIVEAEGEAPSKLYEMPQWMAWQRSNLDAKQSMVHRSAIAYGQAFVVSELGADGKAYLRVLSALKTGMLFEDPISDDNALMAVTVLRYPNEGTKLPGRAIAWDRKNRYDLELTLSDSEPLKVVGSRPHGCSGHCPVTRFVVEMDCEGRVVGCVEPAIPWQDAFNQGLFNLQAAQVDGAHRVIYSTGVTPETVKDETGAEVLDENGNPLVVPFRVGPGDVLMSDKPDAKFGAIEGANLAGYINSLDMLVKDFLALTQTPPDFMLGQMVNLSADALAMAERSFRRKIADYQRLFGEAWERALRLCMILEGHAEAEDLEHVEVVWKDFEQHHLSEMADALSKLKDIGVPPQGLWELIPGVTPRQLDSWREHFEGNDQLASFGRRLESYDLLDENVGSGEVTAVGG